MGFTSIGTTRIAAALSLLALLAITASEFFLIRLASTLEREFFSVASMEDAGERVETRLPTAA